MPRQPRPNIAGEWSHLFSRGSRHASTFIDDHDRRSFVELMAEASTDTGVELHAYSLMTDHYHMVAHSPDDAISRLSAMMRQLVGRYTQRFNRRHGTDGSLFRGRFGSTPIGDDRHLLIVSRYVHRNPLEFVPLERLARYKWSSYTAYVGASARPPWLRTALILGLHGGAQAGYREFVEAEPKQWDPAVGGAASSTASVPLRLVDELTMAAAGVEPATFNHLRHETRQHLRLLAVIVAVEHLAIPAREVAAWCGYRSNSSVWSATHRARSLLRTDPTFASWHREVVATLTGPPRLAG
jgi:REP element-mobilizing transposase RayT